MKNSFFLVIPKQQNNPQRLIEFEQKYLQQWINVLPAANPGLWTRLIYDLILEMNALVMPSQLRLDSLELLRPSLLETEDFLRAKLLKTDFPKDESDHKALRLLVAMQRQFAIGYWITVKSFCGTGIGWFKGKNAALSILRCIKGLSSIIVSHYLMRMSIPDWLWLDLHSFYRLSVKTKTNAIPINIEPNHYSSQKTESPEDSYLQILLLSLAGPSGLMSKEILQVYDFCGALCNLVKIRSKPVPQQQAQCLLLVEEDQAPLFQNQLDETKRRELSASSNLTVLYIDFVKLYQTLAARNLTAVDMQPRFAAQHESAVSKVSINEDLLAYLWQRWSGVALQSADLFSDRLDRYIAVGLSASYRLQRKIDNQQAIVDTEYLARSRSGQLLSGLFNKPYLLSVGSLISIRKTDLLRQKRIVGVINQLMVEKDQSQIVFGVIVIADRYIPVDYRCKIGEGSNEYSGSALLCKQEQEKNKNFLVVDNFLFKNGDKLNLSVNQNEISVVLAHRTNVALGYWRFECIRLAEYD